jgi:catechol 2,3-dioxygenase-like lactoylglutathione lyase family enzyme
MKVKRIMANTATSDLKKAAAFYRDILGLDLVMDHGWFQTYGSDAKMTFQVSFGTEGGSGTPVPDLSIEVDHLEVALARFKKANVPIEYGPVSETWGVRRFFVRDPFGKLINILQHEMNRGTPNKALQRTRSRSGRVFRRLVSLATA